jgi:hypothetical protein
MFSNAELGSEERKKLRSEEVELIPFRNSLFLRS